MPLNALKALLNIVLYKFGRVLHLTYLSNVGSTVYNDCLVISRLGFFTANRNSSRVLPSSRRGIKLTFFKAFSSSSPSAYDLNADK